MTWDDQNITIDQLLLLLRFELHPDNPKIKMDLRRHKKHVEQSSLFRTAGVSDCAKTAVTHPGSEY
jgi:hypothetical protein